MRPLRIVIVMAEPPLPFGHASARWYYLLFKNLVEAGHRVTVFAAVSKVEEIRFANEIFPHPMFDLRCYQHASQRGIESKINALTRPCSYVFSSRMKHELEANLRSGFDVLHMEQVWSGWVGLNHRSKSLLHVHNLWHVDLAQVHPPGTLDRLRQQRLFQAERRIVASYPNLCSCSSRLEGELRRMNHSATISRIPAALDLSGYPYLPNRDRTLRPTVSLIGNMEWAPTLSAAQRLVSNLWPKIKKSVPDATLQLVGWGAKRLLGDYSGLQDITIEENVSDIRPYFERSAILLYAPNRGSGMKIKVLEALAYGIPVVTTSEGIEGIPAVDLVHAGIADDDCGLIDRAVNLLRSPAMQNSQRESGRRLLETDCNPTVAIKKLNPIYCQIAQAA